MKYCVIFGSGLKENKLRAIGSAGGNETKWNIGCLCEVKGEYKDIRLYTASTPHT